MLDVESDVKSDKCDDKVQGALSCTNHTAPQNNQLNISNMTETFN